MKCGNSVDQIMALSTRHQLQGSKINDNSDFIVEVAASFNDVEFDSGGVSFDHPILLDANIDPEFNRVSNKTFPVATRQQIWNWVKELRSDYASILPKFTLSGRHQQRCITEFCQGHANEVDMLYLHLWMEHKGSPELNSYFSEGAELSGDVAVDSGMMRSPSLPIEAQSEDASLLSKKRRRSSSDEDAFFRAVELMNYQSKIENDRLSAELTKISNVFRSPGQTTERSRSSIKELSEVLSSLEKDIEELESRPGFDAEKPGFSFMKKRERWNQINSELERLLSIPN